MSVKALSAVFEESRATDSAFIVLVSMADWADHNGYCYPSYGQIAKKARVSRATAITAIRELVRLGEVERVAKGQAPTADDEDAPGNVRAQWRNRYRIIVMKAKRQVVQPLDHLQASQVVQSARPGGLTDTPQVVQPTMLHIRNRPSVRPSDRPSVSARAGLAFQGSRFGVPRFLHDEFAAQLGPSGLERFDLLGWYARLDMQSSGPIVGDVLTFIRRAFAAETTRVLGGGLTVGSQAPSAYADWVCSHLPACSHPTRCQQLTAIAAEKARAS